MKIHIDPVELTGQPSLWRVSDVRLKAQKIVALDLPGLDSIRVDDNCDEDARVWAWPGQPMYCYQCKVSSNDPNPLLDEVPAFPEPMGITEKGCQHIDAVTQEIVQRCQAAERRR